VSIEITCLRDQAALAKAIGFDAIAAVSKLKRQHDKPL
jgi:hypothetical protein